MQSPHQSEVPQPPIDAAAPRKRSFVKDVLKVLTGTTFSQAVAVLSVPLLARIFAPEAFGTLAVFVSLTTIITSVACLRYEMAIMLPEKDAEAVNVLGLSVVMVALVSALSVPLLYLNRAGIAGLLKAPALAEMLWLAPLAILLGGLFQAFNYWNTRTKHFGRMSSAQVTRSVVTVGLQFAAGLSGHATAAALIAANVIGWLAGALIFFALILRDDLGLIRRELRWNQTLLALKRYRKFPLYDAWAVLLNTVSWQLPNFLLSFFFSQTIVGYYTLGDRLLRVPMSIIGNSLGQVFYQRSAEARVEGTLNKLVERVFEQLVIWGQFPLLLMMIVGKDVFSVILGPQWSEAGVYTQILSWWMFFWFISSPMSTIFRLLEKQELTLYINIAIFVTRVLTLGIGGLAGDPRLALILFSASGVLLYGYLSLAVVVHSGVNRGQVARILLKNIALFAPFALVFLALKWLHTPELWIVILSGGVVAAYYLRVLRKSSLLAFKPRPSASAG